MRRLFLSLIIGVSFCLMSQAQVLVKSYTFKGGMPGDMKERLGVSKVNKPNGNYMRLREDLSFTNLSHPDKYNGQDWKCQISEKTSDGYLALWTKHDSDWRYFEHMCLLYNQQRQLVKELNLCEIVGTHGFEVQDIRYDRGQLFFNFANTGYASEDGCCSKLYCVDVNREEVFWSTKYLTSRDIFTLDDRFIYCGYGFTNEPDFIYLIDRRYGITLTECPIETAHQYMELTAEGLYVEDYNENAYLFNVYEGNAVKITGTGVRLRQGPSTNAEIATDDSNRNLYPLKGDVLQLWGEVGDFNCVRFNGEYLYISKQYSTLNVTPLYDSSELRQAGVRAWTGEENDMIQMEIFDLDLFCKAVGISKAQCKLKENTVYRRAVDSPLASGCYVTKFGTNGLAIFAMSEDCRLFACNFKDAALSPEDALFFREFRTGLEDQCVINVFTETDSKGYARVFAGDFAGRKAELDVENFFEYY